MWIETSARLRRYCDIRAVDIFSQYVAENALGPSVTIDIRSIKEVDTAFTSGFDRPLCLGR
jgi:hypothetical protein